MRAFCEKLPVVLVFLTVVGFSWIFGGASAPHLLPVMPWVWALSLEVLLFLPQRRLGESYADARSRVWKALARDPAMYLTVLFLLTLTVPLFNRGLCSVCDYPQILAGVDPAPAIPFAPFCVNVREHLGVLVWFVPALTAMLAVRHALSHHGRRMLVHLLVWNGAALAALGFLQQATGAKAPYWLDIADPVTYFSSFGYPNMAGAFFVALFAVSAGLWLDNVRRDIGPERRARRGGVESHDGADGSPRRPNRFPRLVKTHYLLLPTALCFFASLATLSRAAIMLAFTLLGLWFLYLCLSLFTSRKNLVRVKLHLGMLLGIVVTVVLIAVFAPDDFTQEVSSLSPTSVADRVTGKAQYHTRVATEIFKDHPVFGVGGWGYKHFCLAYMTDEDCGNIQRVGGVNVHNDYLQLLCEHGIVGAGLFLAIVIGLFAPIFRSWGHEMRVAHFSKRADLPHPTAIFCVPAVVVGVLLAAVANLVHAFGDCVFRSPAVLTQFILLLAAAEGFLPDAERGR